MVLGMKLRALYGLYGFKYGICLKCMDTCLGGMDSSMEFVYGYMFGLYGLKYGICLKCMDTCLGCIDSCRNLTLTPFFDEFWV